VAGAEYSPDAVITPAPEGLIVQLSPELVQLVDVDVSELLQISAENCCICPPISVAEVGVTVTDGITVIYAEPENAGLAWLVAVIVTRCVVVTLVGAVSICFRCVAPFPPRHGFTWRFMPSIPAQFPWTPPRHRPSRWASLLGAIQRRSSVLYGYGECRKLGWLAKS